MASGSNSSANKWQGPIYSRPNLASLLETPANPPRFSPNATPSSSIIPSAIALEPSQQSQEPTGRRQRGPRNSNGSLLWQKSRKDWDNDAVEGSDTSYELAVRWLEEGEEGEAWAYMLQGAYGGNQQNGAKRCREWMKREGGPTDRSELAVLAKVNLHHTRVSDNQLNGIYGQWKKAYPLKEGTGHGEGGRLRANAPAEELAQVEAEIEGKFN